MTPCDCCGLPPVPEGEPWDETYCPKSLRFGTPRIAGAYAADAERDCLRLGMERLRVELAAAVERAERWKEFCAMTDVISGLTERDKRIVELEAELADVHELDRWAKLSECHWAICDEGDDVTGPYWAVFTLTGGHKLLAVGPTPAAARHAAAEWIRGQG